MNFLLEILPVALFFIAYKAADVYVATMVLMASSVVALLLKKLTNNHITSANWITLAAVLIFGGITVFLHDEIFIKIKPSIVYVIMSGLLGYSCLFGKGFVSRVVGGKMAANGKSARSLDAQWCLFFFGLAVANLYYAYQMPLDQWVNFKTFTLPIVTIIFAFVSAFVATYREKKNS